MTKGTTVTAIAAPDNPQGWDSPDGRGGKSG
jgi:hypothetical protein